MYLIHVGVIRLGHNWFLSNNANKRDPRTIWKWIEKLVGQSVDSQLAGNLLRFRFFDASIYCLQYTDHIPTNSHSQDFDQGSTDSVTQWNAALWYWRTVEPCLGPKHVNGEYISLNPMHWDGWPQQSWIWNFLVKTWLRNAVLYWMLRFFRFPVHFRSILSKNWMPNNNAIV